MSIPRLYKLVNGNKMPSLGFGTFDMTGDKLREALDFAIFTGYRHIDTAASYGNEKEIGEVISTNLRAGKVKRKDIFVTSKVPRTHLQGKDVKVSTEKSLEDLKLSFLDMLLAHSPWPEIVEKDRQGKRQNRFVPMDIPHTWRLFEDVCKERLVSNIGVSNFTAEQIKQVLEVQKKPLSNVQLESHVYYQQQNLKTLCDENNIIVSAYAPLGAPGRPFRHVSGMESVLRDPVINHISDRYQKTPGQVLLNFLLNCSMAVLPKSSHKKRIEENFSCLSWSLSPDDFKTIRALDRGVRFFKFTYMRGHPDFYEGKEF